MVKERAAEDAMKAVADAQEQVIQDGGTIHEDAVWDAAEMALDGCTKDNMVKRLKPGQGEGIRADRGWGPGRRSRYRYG